MKIKLLLTLSAIALALPNAGFSQAPTLGTAANFALFSTDGAVSNNGFSHLTGNVGTNNGSSTAFGNVDGVMHDNDGASALAAADLLIAYNQLNAAIPTDFPSALLGNGVTMSEGTYSIDESASLNGTLTLDGGGDANAVFIFQIDGAFSSSAGSEIVLTNNAQACNVFWKIEGLVSLATGTSMKGTIIADQAAIVMGSGVMLEGRALSTTGAVTVNGVTVRIPLGCGSPLLTGPVAPPLGTVICYTIFSRSGEVTNAGVSHVTGDVGTNVGLTTGFDEQNVEGTIHENPDSSTAQAASDLSIAYNYLNALQHDIQLLYPAQFGNDLVLTPHTYLLDAATVLTNTVTLNAQDNANAVFVIKIVGALSTSTHAEVLLINGAQEKNVFWLVDGAVEINDFTEFRGSIICNNSAINLKNGTILDGRALATNGGILTNTVIATMPLGCENLGTDDTAGTVPAKLYPNPFSDHVMITLNDLQGESTLVIYNSLGQVVKTSPIIDKNTRVETNFTSGVYFYVLTDPKGNVQSGKLISN